MNGPASEKKIRWENGQWVCDPLTVRVRRAVDGHLADIDGKDIRVSDDKGWLTAGEATMAADKSWTVSVLVNQDAVLGPPGQASGGATYAVGEVTRPAPPQRQIEDVVTVTVKLKPTGMAEATAAASMFPSAASVLSGAIPSMSLTQEVRYQVQPPRVSWGVQQEDPVPLSGKASPCRVDLSTQLPPGWSQSAKVAFAISEKSKNLGLVLAVEPQDAPPDGLAAQLKLSSTNLVLHPVGELVHEEGIVNAGIDLLAITQSPYLGTQVQPLGVDAQALDICVYFEAQPASRYEWTEQTRVGVVPPEQVDRPPRRCKLATSLKYLKGWSPPAVQWEIAGDPELGDGFGSPSGSTTEYTAPGKARWEEEGKPETRTILCRIGDGEGDRSVAVPQHREEDLYHYLSPFLQIEIGERLVVARLRVRLRPANLKMASDLELADQSVWKSLEREITINVKL